MYFHEVLRRNKTLVIVLNKMFSFFHFYGTMVVAKSKSEKENSMKQYTYMMLKPDAFENGKDEAILNDLENHGLHIEKGKKIAVDMDIMKILLEHYKEVIESMGKEFNFPGKLFNSFYYEGPHYIMPLKVSYEQEEDIIAYSRKLVGKTNPEGADKDSIRGKYSDDNYDKAGTAKRLVNNLIHASDSSESAIRELHIWKDFM